MKKTPNQYNPTSIDVTPSNSTKEPSKLPNAAVSTRTSQARPLFRRKSVFYLLLPLVGTGGLLLGGCEAPNVTRQQLNPQGLEASNRQNNRSLMPTEEDSNFVVAVVDKVQPTVVRINTARTVQNQRPGALNDPLFRRFFGDDFPAQPQERTVRGVGSGFVIDSQGRILTNAHVVNRADTVTVSFADGRTFEGRVIGEDPLTDIAVVQIPANNLQPVELASSAQVRSGQWAIAIGNPLGLQETVTIGVVSGIDRSSGDVGATGKRVGFIQTDAAINPGNSGGPLLNARGQVIGVNTAIIQGAQGIGFAIPIDTAMRIAEQLITTGRVQHPYVGIQMLPLTPDIQERLRNSDIRVQANQGVLIVRIEPGSPADQAGLRPGDVIQSVNNQQVTKPEQIQQQVEKSGVGSQLPLTVQRNGQTVELTVRPAPLPQGARS